MPFYVIRGTFHIKGYSPDGDSIRFQADNEDNWSKLSGPPAGLNGRRHAQLRLEAIDTLETHYEGVHQPMALANAALKALLAGLGITEMEPDAAWTTVTDAEDGTPGYIISRAVEENHRPVAFVYAGAPSEEDGAKIFLTAERVRQSVNYQQLRTGLAYPTYYYGLFHDLREACTEAVAEARAAVAGVWADDRTNSGFAVIEMESITEKHVILPKLFRRLAYYLQGGGPVDGFKQFLAAQMEEVVIISMAHRTHFDTLVEVDGATVRLTEPPENLMFMG
jgi:endonuclease YncB( thermonuclease family)